MQVLHFQIEIIKDRVCLNGLCTIRDPDLTIKLYQVVDANNYVILRAICNS